MPQDLKGSHKKRPPSVMEKETLLLKYFNGSLSTEEQLLFEQYLIDDVDFNAQFEFEKNVQSVINDGERKTLKNKLQQFELKRTTVQPTKINFWKPIRIAASIAILVAASWFIYTSSIFDGPEDLYASNYEKYPNTVYTITRGDAMDTSLERKAFEAYESERYTMAIEYFKELKAETGLDYVDFYLAQSYLANGDEQKAIEVFKKISSVNSDYKGEALWYQALAFLKLKMNNDAVSLLQTLSKEGSYKQQEAKALLKKLE